MNAISWFYIVLVILIAKNNLDYYFSSLYNKPVFFDWFYLVFDFAAAAYYAFVPPVNYFFTIGLLIMGATQLFRVTKKRP